MSLTFFPALFLKLRLYYLLLEKKKLSKMEAGEMTQENDQALFHFICKD